MDYRIIPPEEIIEATVLLPESKSMAARSMTIDFLAGKAVEAPEEACADIKALARGLNGLNSREIDVEGSGTALRFLTAIAAATPGADCRISGNDSLRSRPVGPLVDALRALGADIEYAVREGFPPLKIKGKQLPGGKVEVSVDQSTQYCSALMLAAPLLEGDLEIVLGGRNELPPYIAMTAAMMNMRGVRTEADAMSVVVHKGKYNTLAGVSERDWSAAAFWYEITAVGAAWITLPGLSPVSPQPDRAAADLFARIGAQTEFTPEGAELSADPDLFGRLDADVSAIPDSVPALAVTCALTGIPFTLTGTASLRHKESDRLAALRDELEKIGVPLQIGAYDNEISWDGSRSPIVELPVFDSHGDHRIAMALAPAALFIPGIIIKGAECVDKSYPEFWMHFRAAGFRTVAPDEPFSPDLQ